MSYYIQDGRTNNGAAGSHNFTSPYYFNNNSGNDTSPFCPPTAVGGPLYGYGYTSSLPYYQPASTGAGASAFLTSADLAGNTQATSSSSPATAASASSSNSQQQLFSPLPTYSPVADNDPYGVQQSAQDDALRYTVGGRTPYHPRRIQIASRDTPPANSSISAAPYLPKLEYSFVAYKPPATTSDKHTGPPPLPKLQPSEVNAAVVIAAPTTVTAATSSDSVTTSSAASSSSTTTTTPSALANLLAPTNPKPVSLAPELPAASSAVDKLSAYRPVFSTYKPQEHMEAANKLSRSPLPKSPSTAATIHAPSSPLSLPANLAPITSRSQVPLSYLDTLLAKQETPTSQAAAEAPLPKTTLIDDDDEDADVISTATLAPVNLRASSSSNSKPLVSSTPSAPSAAFSSVVMDETSRDSVASYQSVSSSAYSPPSTPYSLSSSTSEDLFPQRRVGSLSGKRKFQAAKSTTAAIGGSCVSSSPSPPHPKRSMPLEIEPIDEETRAPSPVSSMPSSDSDAYSLMQTDGVQSLASITPPLSPRTSSALAQIFEKSSLVAPSREPSVIFVPPPPVAIVAATELVRITEEAMQVDASAAVTVAPSSPSRQQQQSALVDETPAPDYVVVIKMDIAPTSTPALPAPALLTSEPLSTIQLPLNDSPAVAPSTTPTTLLQQASSPVIVQVPMPTSTVVVVPSSPPSMPASAESTTLDSLWSLPFADATLTLLSDNSMSGVLPDSLAPRNALVFALEFPLLHHATFFKTHELKLGSRKQAVSISDRRCHSTARARRAATSKNADYNDNQGTRRTRQNSDRHQQSSSSSSSGHNDERNIMLIMSQLLDRPALVRQCVQLVEAILAPYIYRPLSRTHFTQTYRNKHGYSKVASSNEPTLFQSTAAWLSEQLDLKCLIRHDMKHDKLSLPFIFSMDPVMYKSCFGSNEILTREQGIPSFFSVDTMDPAVSLVCHPCAP